MGKCTLWSLVPLTMRGFANYSSESKVITKPWKIYEIVLWPEMLTGERTTPWQATPFLWIANDLADRLFTPSTAAKKKCRSHWRVHRNAR